eukprot:6459105-Amphidinium_carterae.2
MIWSCVMWSHALVFALCTKQHERLSSSSWCSSCCVVEPSLGQHGVRALDPPHAITSRPYLFVRNTCGSHCAPSQCIPHVDLNSLCVACIACLVYIVAIMVKAAAKRDTKTARKSSTRKRSSSTSKSKSSASASGYESDSYYSSSTSRRGTSTKAAQPKQAATKRAEERAEEEVEERASEPADEPATVIGSEPSQVVVEEADTPAVIPATGLETALTVQQDSVAAPPEEVPPIEGDSATTALLGAQELPVIESEHELVSGRAAASEIPPPPVPGALDVVDGEISRAVEASRSAEPVTSAELQRHTYLTGKLHLGMSFSDIQLLSESENQMLTEGGMEVGVLRRRMLAYKSISLAALSSRGGELWTQIWLLSWGSKKFRAQDVQALVHEFGSVAKCSRKRLEFMIWTVLKAFMKTTQEMQQYVTIRNDTGAWETVRKYISKGQHHVAWQALLEACGLPTRAQTKGVVRVMYRPDVESSQQQQQQQASGSGTQTQHEQWQQQHDPTPEQPAGQVTPAGQVVDPPPALEKAMPAKHAQKRSRRSEPAQVDVVDLVAEGNTEHPTAAKAPGLTRVGQLWIPTPPPATAALASSNEEVNEDVGDVYDNSSIPAPLIEHAVASAISTEQDEVESSAPKRRRTSSGSLIGVPSPGNVAPLSVTWTRFGLHEKLTRVVKQSASGSTNLPMAPWHEAPPPAQAHVLSNKDRISAISNFGQAAVSAPWRQPAAVSAPAVQIVVAPPPPVRTAPVPIPAPVVVAAAKPVTIPAPPPPQRLVHSAPSATTDRDSSALAYVTPPVTRRALSVASPSSKYSSPAASPDSGQSFAYVRPLPSPPNVKQTMPPPPPIRK